MSLTLDDLFSRPEHYLHSLDGSYAVFVPMDRAAYTRSIFLDRRIEPAAPTVLRIPLEILLDAGEGRPSRCSWIFHVAHCGSTLLARALDALGDGGNGLVLREPLALRQAAIAGDHAALLLIVRMLAKRYPGSPHTVVKANVPVNFVIPEIAASSPDAAAIFLYYGLEDYLLAILRSENHRAWLRRVTGELAPRLGDLAQASDAERAAALWLAQLRIFGAGVRAMPSARTLDAERFFAAPTNVLSAAAALFELQCSAARLEAVVEGPLFRTYAKNPALAFDNDARVERQNALQLELGPELAAARSWLAREEPDLSALVDHLKARAL